MHVSRFAGKTAPSEMSMSRQDAGISFQCAPDNAQRLIGLALAQITDLQVGCTLIQDLSCTLRPCLQSQHASAPH